MAPVDGGTGGGQGGRGPDQQQPPQRGTGPGVGSADADQPARAGTSTRASARAGQPRRAPAKAQVPAQSQGPGNQPAGPAPAGEGRHAESAAPPGAVHHPEAAPHPETARQEAAAHPETAHPETAPRPGTLPGRAGDPAASGAEPDLILTVGGTLTPAVPAPGPSAAPDTEPGGRPLPPDGLPQPGGPVPLDAAAPLSARPAGFRPAALPVREHELLARWARDYASGRPGQQITILYAGCVTAACDLGAGSLQAEGFDISVSMIEDDQPVTRAAVAASPGLARCTLGDLRTVPLPPRSYDLVLGSYVLDRVRSAELVLDRLTAAIKPGGLLFLFIRDRDSAAAFLDRVLPETARRLVWRSRRPGQPGPHPAIYEPLSSARGVHAYAQLRGLVVAERRPLACGQASGPPGFPAARHAVSWLSRGRLTASHDDVLYILRKPEDRFARVL